MDDQYLDIESHLAKSRSFDICMIILKLDSLLEALVNLASNAIILTPQSSGFDTS